MPPEPVPATAGAVEIVFPPHVVAAIALVALALCVLFLLLATSMEKG